jgi:hypothetical protein
VAIAERFDLFILDENGVAADPVVASHRAIEQLGFADAAEVGLRVCQKGCFGEMLELGFEHTNPGTFCRLIIGERIVAEWPGMLSLPKMLSGANACEISDIEKDEHRGTSAGRLAGNNVTRPVVTRNGQEAWALRSSAHERSEIQLGPCETPPGAGPALMPVNGALAG